MESKLYHMDWTSRDFKIYATPERVCSFGLTEKAETLIVAFESGFGFYQPDRNRGHITWIKKIIPGIDSVRLNDGRVDRQGRFWAGSMVEGDFDQVAERGKLYSCDVTGDIKEHMSGILISNSLCWSPDSKKMYFADSPAQTISVYDFDAITGIATNPGIFAEMELNSFPDGSDVDAEGNLWNAEWAGGRVTKYSPKGKKLGHLELPASQPTCVAFDGPDMSNLFITTARKDLSKAAIAKQPQAGNLFIYKIADKGLAAPIYGGKIPAVNS